MSIFSNRYFLVAYSSVFFLLVTPTNAYAGALTFASKVDYGIGLSSTFVATGDFNNDGKIDFVTTSTSSSKISVLINNGNSTFASKVDYTTGLDPLTVVVGDINADGKVDIAVSNGDSDTVSLFINNGDGTFASKVDYYAADSPGSLALGDLNGDGRVDIVTANFWPSTVTVLLQSATGTFPTHVDYAGDVSPTGITLADVNQDGKLDMIAANANGQSDNIAVYLNNGDGTFLPMVTYKAGRNPLNLVAGDLNGDGKVDIVTSNYASSSISVFLNNGVGGFATSTGYVSGSVPIGIALGDLNIDGTLDIIVSNAGSSNVSIFTNNGNGTFATKSDVSTALAPYGLAVGDFNNDGKIDFVTSSFFLSTASVHMNNTVDNIPPTTPVSLIASEVSVTTARISWATSTDALLAGYWVYQDGVLVATTTATLYNFSGLTATTHYSYTVIAFDTTGNMSATSSPVSIYTATPVGGGGGGGGGGGSYIAPVSTTPVGTSTPVSVPTPLTTNIPNVINQNVPKSLKGNESNSNPTIVFTNVLSFGVKNIEVENLQKILIKKGYLIEGNDTGFFGPITKVAVVKFQCDQKIVCFASSTGYGVVGPATRAKLNQLVTDLDANNVATTTQLILASTTTNQNEISTPNPTGVPVIESASFTRSLSVGAQGNDVKFLQLYLNTHGFVVAENGPGSRGNETNYFGPATSRALILFQEAHKEEILTPAGLTSGSGYFGPATRALLKELIK